jgi:hypothetical protein
LDVSWKARVMGMVKMSEVVVLMDCKFEVLIVVLFEI